MDKFVSRYNYRLGVWCVCLDVGSGMFQLIKQCKDDFEADELSRKYNKTAKAVGIDKAIMRLMEWEGEEA